MVAEINMGIDQNNILTVKFEGKGNSVNISSAKELFDASKDVNGVVSARAGNKVYLMKASANSSSSQAAEEAKNPTPSEKKVAEAEEKKNETLNRMADVDQEKIEEGLKVALKSLENSLATTRENLKKSGDYTNEKVDIIIEKYRAKALNTPPISLLREALGR